MNGVGESVLLVIKSGSGSGFTFSARKGFKVDPGSDPGSLFLLDPGSFFSEVDPGSSGSGFAFEKWIRVRGGSGFDFGSGSGFEVDPGFQVDPGSDSVFHSDCFATTFLIVS